MSQSQLTKLNAIHFKFIYMLHIDFIFMKIRATRKALFLHSQNIFSTSAKLLFIKNGVSLTRLVRNFQLDKYYQIIQLSRSQGTWILQRSHALFLQKITCFQLHN